MDFDCKDLPNIIANPRVTKKESASPTDVIFASLRDGGVPVAIKAFLDTSSLPKNLLYRIDDKHQDVLGVKYEMRVYEEIISRITQGHYSPNFVPYIGKMDCTVGEIVKFFGPDMQRGIAREYSNILQTVQRTIINNLKIKMLVTGTPGNGAPLISLYDAWEKLGDKDKYLVMFQIVYSVAVMQEFKLIHNDMHGGNILVAELSKPVTFYYVYKNKIFKMVTKFVPYLFDWDLAFSGLLGKNPKVDRFCKTENICNRFSQKTDLYILFCSLHFEGPIVSTYATPENKVSTHAEDAEPIPLPSPDFAAMFKRTHVPFIKPSTYKLSQGQLIRAFGEAWVAQNLGNVASATFTIYTKSMILYRKTECNPWSFSVSMPSPKEFLEGNYFDSLEVKSLRGAKSSSVYRFPSRATETKETLAMDDRSSIYIDRSIPSTARHIVGRERFPPMGELQTTATFRQLKKAELSVVIPRDLITIEEKRENLYEPLIHLQIAHLPKNPEAYFWAVKLTDLYLYGHSDIRDSRKVAISALITAARWVGLDISMDVIKNDYSIDEIEAQIRDIKKYFKNRIIPTAFQFYMIYESYMDPRKRPRREDVIDFLRSKSLGDKFPTQLPSQNAIIAIQRVAPKAMNNKIRYVNSQMY